MQPCWQAGERLASLSIDNILLSERLSKYWKNVCHPTEDPYAALLLADAGMLRPDVDAGPLQNGHGSSRTSAGELPGAQDHQRERLEAWRARLLPRRHRMQPHPVHHLAEDVLQADLAAIIHC